MRGRTWVCSSSSGCAPALPARLHLPFSLPMQMSPPPTINTPIPALHCQTRVFLHHSNFCSRMTADLGSSLASRNFSRSAAILILLLSSGLSSRLALGPGSGVRAGREGLARSDGRERVKSEDRRSMKANAETGHSLVSRPGVEAADEGDDLWGDPDTITGLKSVLSMGEGGLWEPRRATRCVPIPAGMALCQNIGYDAMRLPNLLGHESPAEAVQQSASWLPLLARECHPDARIFLCSLFAPICLDR